MKFGIHGWSNIMIKVVYNPDGVVDGKRPTSMIGCGTAGFTLTELMVASMIFLMVSTAFTAAMLTALRTQYMATDYYAAMCLARNRIQRARTLDFSSLELLVENQLTVDSIGNPTASGRYQRTTVVSNVSPTCVAFTVKVSFATKSGFFSTQPVEVSTLLDDSMLANE
ncbi:MAG: hypothetical protein A2498_07710 [Lentisphaerae bacterium RIFOXYC12_FULL_60_16]|nr:MAG: hypothetical protein A2498_07710 [Lentisphaerae bacterium RIFOXYC12_FULL_60_16]OGV83525.1 MAG: hypothetical protein A2340_10450 [Lentisphaerae bacterium RIFOXYB12_FULL_60_10]